MATPALSNVTMKSKRVGRLAELYPEETKKLFGIWQKQNLRREADGRFNEG